MIRIKKLGHALFLVKDIERSKAFYRNVFGFRIAEEDPDHGGCFMTLGDDFHTIDLAQHPNPVEAAGRRPDQTGLLHLAFQVESYEALRDGYQTLLANGVAIHHATDHQNQRSIYFDDPDGNRLEIYYEMPNALQVFPTGRHDEDTKLEVTGPGEPLPSWLFEAWPPVKESAMR